MPFALYNKQHILLLVLQTFKPCREKQGLTKPVSPELLTKKRALTVSSKVGRLTTAQHHSTNNVTAAASETSMQLTDLFATLPIQQGGASAGASAGAEEQLDRPRTRSQPDQQQAHHG